MSSEFTTTGRDNLDEIFQGPDLDMVPLVYGYIKIKNPYRSLKIALKAEIRDDTLAPLNRNFSRRFPMLSTGNIAVKVINLLSNKGMKVFEAK